MPTPNVKNKRHVAHLEQVRRQTQAITIGSSIIIVLVVLIVIYGFFIDPLIKQARPVANVNGDTVSVSRFQVQVKIQRLQLINQYQQYLQYAQMFGITDLAESLYGEVAGGTPPDELSGEDDESEGEDAMTEATVPATSKRKGAMASSRS